MLRAETEHTTKDTSTAEVAQAQRRHTRRYGDPTGGFRSVRRGSGGAHERQRLAARDLLCRSRCSFEREHLRPSACPGRQRRTQPVPWGFRASPGHARCGPEVGRPSTYSHQRKYSKVYLGHSLNFDLARAWRGLWGADALCGGCEAVREHGEGQG